MPPYLRIYTVQHKTSEGFLRDGLKSMIETAEFHMYYKEF